MKHHDNNLFSQLDPDLIRHDKKCKENDKHNTLKKDDPFGYGFDVNMLDKASKKKKKNKDNKPNKKNKDKDKVKKIKKVKKMTPDKEETVISLGDSKFARKVLKELHSKELQNSFKNDKILIDKRKFWTR